MYVPAGVTVGLPLRLVVENPEAGARTLWRTLVVVEAGARLTLIEELAPGEPGYLNGALELVLGDGAEVDLVQTQELHHDSYHFTAARAEIARDATLRWFSLGLGGKLGKARQESRLGGPGSAVRATGLYALGERQHLDLDTSQEHAAPNATSDLAYKGALRGHARSVWRGIIKVDKGAQGTDAFQENRNLLLSGHAHADSIPGLQILANDVRCTHAATVSRVDSELLFFLMSRGFERSEAEQMLVTAFYADALVAHRQPRGARAVRRGARAAHQLTCARATARVRRLGACGSSSSAARASWAVTSSTPHAPPGTPSRSSTAAARRCPGTTSSSSPATASRATWSRCAAASWDACLDVNGYLPQHVRASAELLADRVARYAFISTASVYVIPGSPPIDETGALHAVPAHEVETPRHAELYGPLKVACEQEVERAFPGRALILRPGIVAGPYDPTNRFPWWVERVARGGEVLAPGTPGSPVQLVDGRDLAAFALALMATEGDGDLQPVRPAVVVRRADRGLQARAPAATRRRSG